MQNDVFRYIIFLLIGILIFSGCEKEEPEVGNNLSKQDVYDIMNEYYLWYEDMPNIDINQYSSPADVLDAMKYKTLDLWSHITTTEEYVQYYEEGQYIGYGFGIKADEDRNIRIAFVYFDSPAYYQNIQRGWKIHKINEQVITLDNYSSGLLGPDELGIINDFVFIDHEGESVTVSVEKAIVQIHPVIHYSIHTVNETKTGYMVFNHFIGPAYDELEWVFKYFMNNGVEELILDLRYNHGGREGVAVYLAGLIAGVKANNQILNKRVHNSKHADLDTVTRIQIQYYSLDLERVFIISSRESASASELVINGLKPHIETILIGDDTYGKPVGAYTFSFDDYTLIPICFRFLNANDEGDFYNGIPPDAYVLDNINIPFGDPQEDCLNEALYYIENETFSSRVGKKSAISKEDLIPGKGWRFEIGAY